MISNFSQSPLVIGFSNLRRLRSERPLVITKGRGVFVIDENGRDYLEASSSFYCAALGYSDERLMHAAMRQMHELPIYPTGLHRTVDVALELADKITSLVPIEDAHVLFSSTGSEANDVAIKLMRYRNVARGEPRRRKVISRWGSYHGGTIATAALGGGRSVHDAFALPMDDYLFVSQPSWPAGRREQENAADFVGRLIEELEDTIVAAGPGSVAGFVAEPISFSCGFFPPPADYFPRVEEVLDRHGVLFVDDEVICGYGRTGALFAAESMSLNPDIITIAKGMTGAYFPVSATVVNGEVYDWLEEASDRDGSLAHAATYSGHPVGMAVALEVLRIFEEDRLLDRVRARTPLLHRRLLELSDHPLVADVRLFGFAGALQLTGARVKPGATQPPVDAGVTAMGEVGKALSRTMIDHGVLVRVTGDSAVIAPPLIITDAEIEELFVRLRRALADAIAELSAH
jgi:4-aminobutyrate---pyruvate transaminase